MENQIRIVEITDDVWFDRWIDYNMNGKYLAVGLAIDPASAEQQLSSFLDGQIRPEYRDHHYYVASKLIEHSYVAEWHAETTTYKYAKSHGPHTMNEYLELDDILMIGGVDN